MTPGSLLIIKDGRNLVPAVLLVNRGKKLDVILGGAKKRTIAPSKIGLSLGVICPGKLSTEEASRWLETWTAELAESAQALELTLLWEILQEENTEFTLEELCELHSDGPVTPSQRAALYLELETDSTYFKRRQDKYCPRPESEVASIQLAAKRTEEREAAQAAFIQLLVQHQHEQAPAAAAIEPHANLVGDLRRLALNDIDTPEAKRAVKLLDAVPHLPATAEGAFRALIALGIFDPDENLALAASGIPTQFRPDELEAARCLPPPTPSDGQRDLRDLPTLTIDETWTVDPDDALSIEQTADGFRLWIHITQVSRHILPETSLDKAAFQRGASLYLPEGTLPMLPHSCVETLSLIEDRERLTLTAEFELTNDGEVRAEQFYPALIRIDRNWHYDEVDVEIEADTAPFAQLVTLAKALQSRRRALGAIEFSLPELALKVIDDQIILRRLSGQSPARRLVAEMMILAGSRWADFSAERQIPVVYRKQSATSSELPDVSEFPDPYVFFFNIRHLLSPGRLSTQPSPHSGLGLPRYLQGTSPLRRYQDLATQRQLSAVIANEPPPYDVEEILRIAAAADAAARENSRLERDRINYWLLRHMEDRVGQTLEAMVLGSAGPNRHAVLLSDYLTEQVVRSDQALEPGQGVELKLLGLNLFERTLNLTLL